MPCRQHVLGARKIRGSYSREFARPRKQGFSILSEKLTFAHDSGQSTKAVLDRFALLEEFSFVKTIMPVSLAQLEGEKLLSRS